MWLKNLNGRLACGYFQTAPLSKKEHGFSNLTKTKNTPLFQLGHIIPLSSTQMTLIEVQIFINQT